MAAAKTVGLPVAAQILGVQTAIGESTLEIKSYGDAAGPDSRGLFQQRDNGAWGTLADRMDATISATNFFKALQTVEGWDELEPSTAIHHVQRNDDPNHYTRFRGQATEIVKALGGQEAVGIDVSGACPATGDKDGLHKRNAASGQLKRPAPGTLMAPLEVLNASSPFGSRTSPITGSAGEFHLGQDYAAACGTSVYSADAGVVRAVGWHQSGGGNRVEIDHGNGLITTYNHLEGIAVKKGESVDVGEIIAKVGTTGSSTGCHLHFETILNGSHTNPAKWTLLPIRQMYPLGAIALASYAPGEGNASGGDAPDWAVPGSDDHANDVTGGEHETPGASPSDNPVAMVPSPTPSSSPGPTPSPMVPTTPSPSPSPTPMPTPAPSPAPTPVPEPTQAAKEADPVSTTEAPTPSPELTTEPASSPTSSAGSVLAPTPTPAAEPDVAPTSTP